MYVGDNDTSNFPLVVSAVQGADRVYRYSGLDSQAPGTSSSFPGLVGWEWDARVANGAEPAGVVTLASSPVTGNILQGNGSGTTPGSTSSSITKYTASSGALVFATGTNYWSRGLAVDGAGNGNVDLQIQQVTTNVLADMGALPDTPASNIVLDSSAARPDAPANLAATLSGSTSLSLNWSPVNGVDGYNVYRTLGPRDSGLPLEPKSMPHCSLERASRILV